MYIFEIIITHCNLSRAKVFFLCYGGDRMGFYPGRGNRQQSFQQNSNRIEVAHLILFPLLESSIVRRESKTDERAQTKFQN